MHLARDEVKNRFSNIRMYMYESDYPKHYSTYQSSENMYNNVILVSLSRKMSNV